MKGLSPRRRNRAASLEVLSGPLEGKTSSLPSGEVRPGNHPRSFLKLADRAVSHHHAALVPTADGHVLGDERSSNGTFINGERVGKKRLRSGDLIQIGSTRLRYSLRGLDPLVGRTLGVYRIEEEIGRGAMATVYRAAQLDLDRAVATLRVARSTAHAGRFTVISMKTERPFLKDSRRRMEVRNELVQENSPRSIADEFGVFPLRLRPSR